MKRKYFLAILIIILAICALTACTGDGNGGNDVPSPSPSLPTEPDEPIVEVLALVSTVTINVSDIEDYDYTVHFAIVEDGRYVDVDVSYIDASEVPEVQGSGTVSCTYKGVSATLKVIVADSIYELNVSKTYVSVLDTEVASYDFLSLFTATKDGEVQPITADMIMSTVKAELGVYEYSVTYHGIKKAVTVDVDNGVTVNAYAESYSIRDDELFTYDYTKCFIVRKNGKYVSISAEDCLTIEVTMDGGTVTCEYGGKSASVKVVAIPLEYRIVKLRDSFTVYTGKALEFDYTSLFVGYVDGVKTEITTDNLTSDVTQTPGEYTITVTLGRISTQLPVIVSADHVIEIVPAYASFSIKEDKLSTFDLADFFWLYVDEELRDAKTLLTFDDSELRSAKSGETKTISIGCTIDDTTCDKSFEVAVTAKSEPVVTVKNATTYPNSEKLDLTSLFEITIDGEPVAVTSEMISGTVDYLTEGTYEITLTYDEKTYVAKVDVRRGVAISVAGDPIVVPIGTDKDIYDFASDFVVTVNGIRFRYLERYIDAEQADFTKVGLYDVVISVPYSSESGVVSNVTYTAKYKVVETKSEVNVVETELHLGNGVTTYDYGSNLIVYVNGVKQTLTSNRDWADALTVYYELVSEPVDFGSSGTKDVKLAVFADGLESDPTVVEYKLVVYANIVVKGTDKAVFSGTTVKPEDLFVVTENGETVYPTFANITGKVDVFVPGVYVVEIDYKGIHAESRIVVIDSVMKGVYHTKQTTAPVEKEEDEDGDVVQDAVAAKVFEDFVVNDDGTITFGSRKVEIIGAEDEKTVVLNIGSNKYTMHYADGIVVLEPDNTLKMSYTDSKRPFLFINESVWSIKSYVQVMNSSNPVIFVPLSGYYTIDTFRLVSANDPSVEKWYGLNVRVTNRAGSDTEYALSWGDVEYSDGFEAKKGTSASLVFDGVTYHFDMNSDSIGRVDVSEKVVDYKYAGTSFTGKIDGTQASVKFGRKEEITIVVGSTTLIGSAKISSLASGAYLDYENDVLFVYDYNEKKEQYYSYRISLNTETRKFTVEDKDSLFGYYKYSDAYVFIDGYGGGYISFGENAQTLTATYTRNGNEVKLKFAGTDKDSAYGTEATFYVAELLNVLTVKDAYDSELTGSRFVNQKITEGALVTLDSYSVGVGTRKDDLLKTITIVTKDGALTEAQKKSMVDLQVIKINDNAFYQFAVNGIEVEGETVTAYYVVEYTAKPYNGHALVQNYGSGICDTSTTLSIDAYGYADIVYNKVAYRGEAILGEDGTFIIKAYSEDNKYLAIRGYTIADGIISITASGAEKFVESFTTGSVEKIGYSGSCVIREITVNDVKKYFASSTAAVLGGEAELLLISGDGIKNVGTIIKAKTSTAEFYVKVVKWGDAVNGLTMADALMGTYTNADGNDLTLDGFGSAVIGEEHGSYVINVRRTVTVITAENAYVFAINTDGTYRIVDIVFDESLIAGKRFSAEHVFYCGDYSYSANTTFVFGGQGIVTVRSTSSEHDEGSDSVDACTSDVYSPEYATADGVASTYTVSANVVTVNVNGATFTFVINDVTAVTSITATSTSVSSDAHGYFAVGTEFTA